MGLTIAVTVGKYLLLVGLYAFAFVVFRGIMRQLAAESARSRTAEGVQQAPRRVPASARAAQVTVARPRAQAPSAPVMSAPAAPAPVSEPSPEPAASPEPRQVPEPVEAREPEPVAVERPAVAHLRVIESGDGGPAVGEVLPLSAAVTIGRSADNSVRIADRFISSRHALICLREGHRLLMDRGSTNGTFVNGRRVENEVELRDGDRIGLGNTVFEYRGG